jgi:serine/threonine-protein kinase HipA
MRKCLLCALPLDEKSGSYEYHIRCSRSFFGEFPPPHLDVSLDTIQELAVENVVSRTTVTGVQKKLSLGIEKIGHEARLTIVGLWGKFILKPPTNEYPFLPENEYTVMRLAHSLGIPTVPYALMRLSSGELAYVSKRIDRGETHQKLAMEDFCQISERLTEDKYKGSMERIGKLVRKHSVYAGLDVLDLFERVLFCYLVGNADMHLKNFSLIETPQGMRLSPAYDLVSTILAIADDPEDTALTVNGKKSKLTFKDFSLCAQTMGIHEKIARTSCARFVGLHKNISDVINTSFLPKDAQKVLTELVESRIGVLTPEL